MHSLFEERARGGLIAPLDAKRLIEQSIAQYLKRRLPQSQEISSQ